MSSDDTDVVPVVSLVFAGSVGYRVIVGVGKVFIEKVLRSFVGIRSVLLIFA